MLNKYVLESPLNNYFRIIIK